jgi:hypothetical protein
MFVSQLRSVSKGWSNHQESVKGCSYRHLVLPRLLSTTGGLPPSFHVLHFDMLSFPTVYHLIPPRRLQLCLICP